LPDGQRDSLFGLMHPVHITPISQESSEPSHTHLRGRWGIALLLGLGVLINYFDRVNISVSRDALGSAFGINDVMFGYLAGAYNWTYALCQLPVGALLDRVGVRKIGWIGALIWSVASAGAGVSPNLTSLFAARLLLGIGEAPTFPANAKAIGLWFPPEERSLATSLFDAAAKFATAIGVPLIGLLLLHVGWRLTFIATGVVSFLYFLLFFFFYRNPPPHRQESTHADTLSYTQSASVSFGYLMRQRKVIGLSIGFGAYNYVFYLLLTWLPTYLSSALHITLLHSFLYTGVPWLVATATDLAIGGWLVDALIRRGFSQTIVRKTVLIAGTLLGTGIFGAAHAHSSGSALFWISVSIGGLAAAAPVSWSLPSLIAPDGAVGKVGGIMNFVNQLSAIAAPIVTGYLYSSTHSFALAFAVPCVYLSIGIAGYIFLLGKIEQIPAPLA
jgi:MFS family permease